MKYWYHQHDRKSLKWLSDGFFTEPLGVADATFFDENYSWIPFKRPESEEYYEYWENFEKEG